MATRLEATKSERSIAGQAATPAPTNSTERSTTEEMVSLDETPLVAKKPSLYKHIDVTNEQALSLVRLAQSLECFMSLAYRAAIGDGQAIRLLASIEREPDWMVAGYIGQEARDLLDKYKPVK